MELVQLKVGIEFLHKFVTDAKLLIKVVDLLDAVLSCLA